MQFYLSGVTPLFWKQVASQPKGIYNLGTQQTTSAAIKQLFVAFVSRPVGTLVDIYMSINNGNFNLVSQAKIIDNSGFLYSRFDIPYTRNLDGIEIMIRENATNAVLANESFSSSHIDFMFEIQAAAFSQTQDAIQQLEQDNSIDGVDDGLLYGKFGVYTGLNRRTNQSSDEYRDQTACLWKAFQHAGTEKGVGDAIACVVGASAVQSITPTYLSISNRIFVEPQIGPTANNPAFYTDQVVPVPMLDVDHPHSYIAQISAGFHTNGYDAHTTIINALSPLPIGSATAFNEANVQVFAVNTPEAIANEVVVEVSTGGFFVGEGTLSIVVGENVTRLPGTYNDELANGFVATTIVITSYYLTATGPLITATGSMPVEGIDFSADHLAGTITWSPTGINPAAGTIYTANYSYRLDEAISIVIKKVKPAHKKVVVAFSDVTFNLPNAVIA